MDDSDIVELRSRLFALTQRVGKVEARFPKNAHGTKTLEGHIHRSQSLGGTHGGLSGLLVDDHPQYAALGQAEIITSSWTFLSPQAFSSTVTIASTASLDTIDFTSADGTSHVRVGGVARIGFRSAPSGTQGHTELTGLRTKMLTAQAEILDSAGTRMVVFDPLGLESIPRIAINKTAITGRRLDISAAETGVTTPPRYGCHWGGNHLRRCNHVQRPQRAANSQPRPTAFQWGRGSILRRLGYGR